MHSFRVRAVAFGLNSCSGPSAQSKGLLPAPCSSPLIVAHIRPSGPTTQEEERRHQPRSALPRRPGSPTKP
eukprot:3709066-Alexandrium_andersonii.AAC.1